MAEMTITIPKIEYVKLTQQAAAYREFVSRIFELPLRNPIGEVMEDFQNTGLYSDGFLEDLESGLRKSSYAKKYGHQTAAQRP